MSVTIEAIAASNQTGCLMALVVIGIFAVIWGWIAYEIHRAPTCDKDGNIISNSRQSNNFNSKQSNRLLDGFKDKKEDVE